MPERIGEKMKSGTRLMATILIVVLLVLLAIILKNLSDNRTYSSYRIEKSELKTDSVSRYEYVDGYVLRYSRDGAALINQELEALWTVTFSMEDPRADVCGRRILLYDRLGTDFYIFDTKKMIGSFSTGGPIIKARISGKDTVAALLRDGEHTSLVYYKKDGSQIAAGESSIINPGYPVSLSISQDGLQLAIAYLTAADGMTGTTVRIYHFGADGRGHENNMTAEFVYPGVFAPEVQYLGGNECAVFRDDGFTIIKGSKEPEEWRTVSLGEDICSVFHDGTHLGFITRSTDAAHKYCMSLYSTNGNLISSVYADTSYERVRVCGDQVILSNHTEFSVLSTRGVCRFRGRLKEGNISDALKIGKKRILIMTDQKMEVITLH